MQKCLFLDRDGVINIDKNYVYKIVDFEFYPDIFELCNYFLKKKYIIIIISNQAGIGRGYYNKEDFKFLMNWVCKQFESKNIKIHDIYYCPHHIESEILDYKKDCFFRKPNPGMIFKARDQHNIDLSKSILIGDQITDIKAGISSGIKKLIYINRNNNIVLEDKKIFKTINSLYELIKY